MFELIRANKRKSMALMLFMLVLLLATGFAIGFAVLPGVDTVTHDGNQYFVPLGGLIGMAIAFLIWGVQALIAFNAGDRLLMASVGAKEIQKSDHPRLFNVVEEMTLAAQLPAMPKVYIIEDDSLNAFAAGRDAEHAAVAVTSGLLAQLNRDQLQGVIAHEVAHIANRDVLFMTMAGIMVGSIIMITEMFLRMMWYSNVYGSRRYSSRRSNKNEGAAKALLLVVALILAVVAPLIAQLLYFACSRQREYLADAGGAVYTRYPEGLASALEAISRNPGDRATVSKATAPMYIVNPLEAGKRAMLSLGSTHPPIEERVRILRTMGGASSYADYASAWGRVSGKSSVHIPASALAKSAIAASPGVAGLTAPATQAKPEQEPTARQRQRDTHTMLQQMNGVRFVPCTCGATYKVPPDYKKSAFKCAKCGVIHKLAAA